ncbi:MAG TPA: TOBE domain-containing protein [Myxococcota bacterium]|nr:TOBE domain-containing protein [Myxococcota bacterium]HRY94485.1 TOBE domain-containing protein [Myxococcota bacterium]HSA20067.1 TOBE domain-containing protein [Myxococcota bacterium]
MKIGVRNNLVGKVTQIKKGTVMCQVKVAVPAKSVMESVMTLDSLKALALKKGDKVRILVKAVSVLLIKD